MPDQDVSRLPAQIKDAYDACSRLEQGYLRQILQELSDTGYSDTYQRIWLTDYKEIPVSITTFLDSDLYLGKATRNGSAVYPFWRTTLSDIFNAGNKYNELIFTGGTRIGKSSTAITVMSYMLYRLMCMRDPQKFFEKKDVSKFSILFFNITKDLAKGVMFREFNDTLRLSPWFAMHGQFTRSDRDFCYVPEGGKVVVDFGSDASHALGKQVFAAACDEVNFSRAGIKDVNKAKQHIQDTYNTISARIKGTFRKGGEVYGKLLAVSSKRSDSDFMEDYYQRQIAAGAGDHIYVVDKPQWEVLPSSMFSSKRFYIAVGSKNQRGFVIPDEQSDEASLADVRAQGFKIMNPPIDMRPEFLADFDIALRDLAGVSVPGTLSFITQASLDACVSKARKNPFYTDVLSIGNSDSLTIEEFFHINEIDPRTKSLPHYMHLDLSLNTDRTGISMVSAGDSITSTTDDGMKVSQVVVRHDFSVAIQAPRGDKIPYSKILTFICWLRKQGFNIVTVSRDQFQSEFMGELLEARGFSSPKVSMDRTPEPYVALRSMLLEKRIDLLPVPLLMDELIYLQRDSITGKIDHLIGRSKDVSDTLAGAVWDLISAAPAPSSLPVRQLASVMRNINTPGGRSQVNRINNNLGYRRK